MVRHALILWVKEGKWDVWVSTRLPAEHRQEGAIGMFPWNDGKTYLGKVIKISSSTKEIERAEAKLCEKIREANSEAPVHGKRNSKQPARTGKSASESQVSQALGEKRKLNSEQAALKKQAALDKKQREEAMKDAEMEEDLNLLPVSKRVKRSLLFDIESVSSSMMPKTNELLSGEDTDSEDDQPMGTVADLDSVHDEDEENLDDDEDEDRMTCHEPSIADFKNPNTERFLRFLLNAFNPTPESWTLKGSSSEVKSYAKPLKGAEGQKMVRLKKNHSLMVSKASKAALLVDFKSRQSSTVFLRKTLEQIYGADQLSRMTAMGRLKDSVGISKQDLNAIYEFVTEYSTGHLSWVDFKITINKKCSSMKSLSNKKSSSKKPKETMRSISTSSDSDQGIVNMSNSEPLGVSNSVNGHGGGGGGQSGPKETMRSISTSSDSDQEIVNMSNSEPLGVSNSVNGHGGGGQSGPFGQPHQTYYPPYVSQSDHVRQPDQHASSRHYEPYLGYQSSSMPSIQPDPRTYVNNNANYSPSMACGNQAGQHSYYGYQETNRLLPL